MNFALWVETSFCQSLSLQWRHFTALLTFKYSAQSTKHSVHHHPPDKSVSRENMKIFFLFLAISSIKSAPTTMENTTHPTPEESCDSTLRLGDITLGTSNRHVTDTTHMTGGLKVLGCGSWMVYSKTGRRGSEACIDASHGKMSLSDIGLQRVRSVRRRKTTCPKIARYMYI